MSRTSQAQAVAIAAHYHRGGQVTVYYDPSHPARAVLEPGYKAGNIPLTVIGIILASASVVGLLAM